MQEKLRCCIGTRNNQNRQHATYPNAAPANASICLLRSVWHLPTDSHLQIKTSTIEYGLKNSRSVEMLRNNWNIQDDSGLGWYYLRNSKLHNSVKPPSSVGIVPVSWLCPLNKKQSIVQGRLRQLIGNNKECTRCFLIWIGLHTQVQLIQFRHSAHFSGDWAWDLILNYKPT